MLCRTKNGIHYRDSQWIGHSQSRIGKKWGITVKINVCSTTHEQLFDALHNCLPTEFKNTIDNLLIPQTTRDQHSLFYLLKEYPPSATISSIQINQHHAKPKNFYKTLIATLISQATNLGIVAMSASVKEVTVDMLRHILQSYVREETIKAASAEIVNHHHLLPFSEIQGYGTLSSSDAQRFKIRADSLLAAYYPRYYGYYEKAIGIYTHVSDQYSVISTQVISCNPREALLYP